MPAEQFLLRSLLFAPGHDEKMLVAAAAAAPDALAPDLEDSVPSAAYKDIARSTVRELICAGRLGTGPVFPRVNDRDSSHLLRDVGELAVSHVAGFVYPKAQSGQDIGSFAQVLESHERERRLPTGQFKIIALIETTAAVLKAEEICRASERVIALGFGGEDFLVDLHGRHDAEQTALLVPRALIATAARACGVIPLDTVHTAVHDLAGLACSLALARNLGFAGAMALHPRQLPVMHEVFSPSPQEVASAREIIELAARARQSGRGVVVKDGRFIAPPTVAAARQLLRRHELIVGRRA